ncbi:phage baseplate assembly protein V [Nocardia amamiensis]|uniref:phage baseplate assembly protein V n=1 Tax=Nocardia amamiensis TaxID=404578 RepID=UPI0033FC01D2
MTTERFYGVYRGSVESDIDPLMRGRVQVKVPRVFGDGRLAWAEPCVSFAGSGVGAFAIPQKDASVWVMFEGGDPDYPVLAGGFWQLGESPAPPPGLPQVKVFKTDSVTVTVSDLPGVGGVTVEVGPPAVAVPMTLVMDAKGITLSCGNAKVALDPVKVSVNNGALEVI